MLFQKNKSFSLYLTRIFLYTDKYIRLLQFITKTRAFANLFFDNCNWSTQHFVDEVAVWVTNDSWTDQYHRQKASALYIESGGISTLRC